jgi:hypothetical protein
VSVLFLLLLPVHVLWAFDVPAKAAGPSGILGCTFGGFHPSQDCSSCHERIVKEWQGSMHAHGLTSPIMVAQNNLAHRETLASTSSPDPQNVCVNCHGPLATALSQSPVLPFRADQPLSEPALLREGITCSVCHQWQGESVTAGAGLTAFQAGLVPGHTFFGPYDDAAGNAYHQSKASPLFKTSSELCRNCHSVQYDRNGDGKIERGTDLVLQTLYDEWADFAKSGSPSCIDCHMPVVQGSRAAESALLPLEQDSEAPKRTLRSHHFVAGDYPLDDTAARDASRAEREALLKSAITLELVGSPNVSATSLSFDVSIKNSGTGHNFPGGFGFVRQMWLEVTVLNQQGQVITGSGIVRSPVNDLCDASILDDASNPMRPFLVGCGAGSDRQLVNLQQMLLDKVELLRDAGGNVQLDARGQAKLRGAPGAQEVVVQYITSGPVPRVRPATGKPTPPLVAGEARVFPYSLDLPSGVSPSAVSRLRVRLLFRPTPPYFLRALAKSQTAADGINLASLVENLEILEMARTEAILQR